MTDTRDLIPLQEARALTARQALDRDIADAGDYARKAHSPATLRAYASDWRRFTAWCIKRGVNPLPASPTELAAFLAAEANPHNSQGDTRSPKTIARRLAAVRYYHANHGYLNPAALDHGGLARVMAGIRNEHGRPTVKKTAATSSRLAAMIEACSGETLGPIRDRAILALGMAAAMRRSEIVALTVADLEFVEEGLKVTVRQSKTDQASDGAVIAVPEGSKLRPVSHLRSWLEAAGHDDGPLFRRLTRAHEMTEDGMSDRAIARLVKRAAYDAGFDLTKFSGHSLRSGFLTDAARNRATVTKMREVSRHKSVQVLLDYVQSAEIFDDHAGKAFL